MNDFQYVPILRWNGGERVALRQLSDVEKKVVIPLIEVPPKAVTPRKPKARLNVPGALNKVASQLHSIWGGGRVFMDLGLIGHFRGNNIHPIELLWAANRQTLWPNLFPKLIPVTTLDRDDAYQAAVKTVINADGGGICLRLYCSDLGRPNLTSEIEQLLNRFGVLPQDVDVVVDYEIVTDPTLQHCVKTCDSLPFLMLWRSFTIIGGSMPKYLTQWKPNDEYEHPRAEWQAWKTQVTASASLARRPQFGDYTVLHPVYEEARGIMNVSASLRYTSENHTVIVRGEWLLKPGGLGYQQYPAHAASLTMRPEFCGPNFSYGDEYIAAMGAQLTGSGKTPRTGSPTTWISAAINHHLTFVVRQIANLLGP